jgi:hypothetical protein
MGPRVSLEALEINNFFPEGNQTANLPAYSSDATTNEPNYPFNAGIKSLRATLPDEIFYWEFCYLNHAFR